MNQLCKYFQLEKTKNNLYLNGNDLLYILEKEKNILLSNDYYRPIGSLLYISSCTRFKIFASIYILSRRCNTARKKDLNAVKGVISFLKTTNDIDLQIFFKRIS